MFIDKDSIKVNGISIGKYITEAQYGFNKLWKEGSGRTLTGKMVARLLGIFPKITLNFKPLSKEELEIIAPILDSQSQTIEYYDASLKKMVTMTTYTGDWTLINKNIMVNEPFTCSFISVDRRK